MSSRGLLIWFLRINGVAMLANGAWMLADAFHWFATIPAGLADTGAPNGHFIRDVGIVYLILGGASLWCAAHLDQCRPVFICLALFMAGHAAGHVIEILLGTLPHSHWWIDFPLVLLPGVAFGLLLVPAVWVRAVRD